jgi:hypothetical protein
LDHGAIEGRLKVIAKKGARTRERKESNKPKINSNSTPETKMLLILATLDSLLYCAEYFTIAVLIPLK